MKLPNPKYFALAAALIFSGAAYAQTAPDAPAGVLAPPAEVGDIVSIDAHNHVIVGTMNSQDPDQPQQYSLTVPRHIYSGAIARVFGGSIVSTEALVIPESAMRSNFGAPGGVTQFGANQNFNGQNTNGQNFGNRNWGNQGPQTFGNSFPYYAPRVPVNNTNQFDRVLGFIDRPMRQAQIGITQ